jgi:hypothetical protein
MPNDKPQAKSPTFIFVGGIVGAAILAVAYYLLGWIGLAVCTGLLAWETWTFFNKYKNDTISEILWVLGKRPLIPFIFGSAFVASIAYEAIPLTAKGLYIAAIIGFLMGHFFWQAHHD